MTNKDSESLLASLRVRFWVWLATVAVRRANRLDIHPDGLPSYRLSVPIKNEFVE